MMENTNPVSAEKRLSRIFALSRLLAILCVISAHFTIKNSVWIADFYSAIGSVGVVLFFITAGYYYKRYPLPVLCRKKLKGVVLPWVVLGSLVWFVTCTLQGTGYEFAALLLWLLGYKTYLYFVVVLLICFALFYVLRRTVFLLLAIVVHAISLALTVLGYMQNVISWLHITNYLNVLNWVGFFAIGLLLQRVPAEQICRFIYSTRWLWMAASLVWIAVIVLLPEYSVGYFSATGWAYELVASLGILSFCSFSWKHDRLWLSISAVSYPIYLLHMMFIGILFRLYSLNLVTTLFANVIVLLSVYLCIIVGVNLAKKLKCEELYATLVGVRD